MKAKIWKPSDLVKLKHQLLHTDPIKDPYEAVNAMADAFSAVEHLQENLGIWRSETDDAVSNGQRA